MVHVPFSVYDITGKDEYFLTNRASEDFIRSEINGKVYLLGNRAKISLLEATQRANAHQMDTFYTIGRFKTKEYEVAFQSFIAYALYQYQLYSVTVDKTPFTIEQLATSKIEIRVGSALPHARADEVWEESILPLLLKPIDLKLLIGENEPIDVKLKFSPENLCMNSQVLSAMFSVVMDEEGNYKEENISSEMLPMLVIDAGYLTVGISVLTQDGQVIYAESNQEFAMNNVNERVANIIKENRPDITAYNIETLAKANEKIRYSYKDGDETKYALYDVVAMREEEIERTANNLIVYLLKKFNDLLDIKSVVVAGGTGEKYYEYIKPVMETRLITSILSKPIVNGKEVDPVFAVVVGLYRSMQALFD